MSLLIKPGETGPVVKLSDVLKEAHEARRVAVDREIQERKNSGAPLDDDTDWTKVGEAVAGLSLAHGAKNTGDVVKEALAILALANGNELTALKPYEEAAYFPGDLAEYAGLGIQMRVISDVVRRDLALARQRAAVALQGADDDTLVPLRDAYEKTRRDTLTAVLVKVDDQDVTDDVLDAVSLIPTLPDLLTTACRYFLELTPKKALRCGQPAPAI